ncbi:unnamed protein product [Alopecurus aequalis]
MLQSLGIHAIASLVSKRNAVKEVREVTSDEAASAVKQGEDPDYIPKEKEVTDGEEVDDTLVKTVKHLQSRRKKAAVRKTSKRRKSSQVQEEMAPVRVMAPEPRAATKRLLDHEEYISTRATRQRLTKQTAAIYPECPLHRDRESSLQIDDELLSREEANTMPEDGGPNARMDIIPVARSVDRSNMSVSSEDQQEHGQLTHDEGDAFFLADDVYDANFEMDTNSPIIQLACNDMLQKISKNIRHRIKKKLFDPVEASQVSIKSQVPDLSDEEWEALVKLWSTPRHKKQERNGEELSTIDLFKATHNSKKFGFSEEARNAIAAMESMHNEPIPEGQEPKYAIKIVEDVLNKEVKQSTFLMNVGLQSSKKNTKPAAVIAAHVRDLEEKLERSKLQTEAMQEEIATIKKRAEEAEAAQALRDKDYELLRKKTQEQEDKLAHLMALFGAKQVGISCILVGCW